MYVKSQDFIDEEMSVLICVLEDFYLAADKCQAVTLVVALEFLFLSNDSYK